MQANARYYLLYLPLIFAYAVAENAVVSYLVAWSGSFFIFFISFTNKVKPVSVGVPFAEKVFKPLFLTQLIFAGYMCITSIFFFLDQMGYEYLIKVPTKRVLMDEVALTATCQRFYLLGHAAFVHAMLFCYKQQEPRYIPRVGNWPLFFLKIAAFATPLGFLCSKISGLSVLANSIEGLAFVASAMSFALAILLRKTALIMIAGLIFVGEMAQALVSGFKEPVIVNVLMLGLFLFPFYKRTITLTFVPLLIFLFTVLPTYVNTFRSQISNSGSDGNEAKEEALFKVQNEMVTGGIAETNWVFLTGRISEIGMFTKYVGNQQFGGEKYGFQILGQTMVNLIPRVFWREKPITEVMVMARVLENGIVADYSVVSAKPQYIVDGYLSAGTMGIWLALFLYGAIAQIVANYCSVYFGGYFFGIAFVYTGMFRFMWRGNCFEFIYNNIFYGVLSLIALFFIFKWSNVLVPLVPQKQVSK